MLNVAKWQVFCPCRPLKTVFVLPVGAKYHSYRSTSEE